jgi:hypothetical protein
MCFFWVENFPSQKSNGWSYNIITGSNGEKNDFFLLNLVHLSKLVTTNLKSSNLGLQQVTTLELS